MYKFFVADNQIKNGEAKIIGEDVKHIKDVLRLNEGEKIIICNKDAGISYNSSIETVSKEEVVCKIIAESEIGTEPIVNVDIYQGLPKADKMEYIIQKTTEIGVKNIYPVALERCVVKLDKKDAEKKLVRWNKIAEAAAKQSKRDYIPRIKEVINLENICKNIPNYDIILLAYENEKGNTIKAELQKIAKHENLNIGVIIGPEGGITEKEANTLIDAGAKCVTLGNRILRAETAPIVVLSDIIYEFEL